MKSFGFQIILLTVVATTIAPISLLQAQTSKVRFETIKEKCKGIPRDKRVRITVPRFSVSSRACAAIKQCNLTQYAALFGNPKMQDESDAKGNRCLFNR
jgi:hypothetical protein